MIAPPSIGVAQIAVFQYNSDIFLWNYFCRDCLAI